MKEEIIRIINEIKVNKRNGKSAVYKPLLLLIILDAISKGHENHFAFKTIYQKLENLMEEYGWETISSKKAQYPFYFLATSEVWEINIDRNDLKNPDAPSKKEMQNAIGKLNDDIYHYLVQNPPLLKTVMEYVSNKFFNKTINIGSIS